MLKTAARLSSVRVAVIGLGLAQPAFAGAWADISTPAWTNHDLPLFTGPNSHSYVRTMLPGGLRISVDECSNLWCRIHHGRVYGYAFLYALSFGHGPDSIDWPPPERHYGANAWSW